MWFDASTNTLIYPTFDPRLLEHCDGGLKVNGTNAPPMMAIPVSIKNLQIARHFGYEVIRPLHTYTWPRAPFIRDPFHAQTETANFLTCTPRAHVLSDMGTGKTLASLWAADALMQQERFSALIVAPLSTLQTVWQSAATQHFMRRRKLVIIHGTEQQRLRRLSEPADFYCINHDGIKVGARFSDSGARARKLVFTPGGFASALQARADIRMAIVDEAGAFRDSKSLRSRVARSIVANRDYYWAMTGTPMPNGPMDAYGLAKLLNDARGESWTNFRNRMMLQVGASQWNWKPRAGSYEAALAMLSPYIRFSIEDCQDLPELMMQDRQVDLSPEQRWLLKDLKNKYLLQTEKGDVSAANEAALRSKLMQICQGAVYDDAHKTIEVDAEPRFRALKEIIEEAGAKVLIFAGYTSVVNRLNMGLKGLSRAVILGSTPPKERASIIRAFQSEREPHVIIAHPETISHGQTLTAAATTVWWGPIDKADVYIQANKRMHRPGQTRACTVVNLAGSPVEREAYRRLANNEGMQGLMLKLAEAGI